MNIRTRAPASPPTSSTPCPKRSTNSSTRRTPKRSASSRS
nr:MAG TPA: hypothetical protein [Caudoviricetes sp.]